MFADNHCLSDSIHYKDRFGNARDLSAQHPELVHPQGTYARALLVVSYESELALVAKKDRNEGFM